MKKVGLLTSGGDCQGLNAALRGIVKSLYARMGANVEIIGIQDGYRGLIEGICRHMEADNFSGILTLGGTVLGTSRQPFKRIRAGSEDQVKSMKNNYSIPQQPPTAVSLSLRSWAQSRLADEIEKMTGQETRVTVPGHFQRGGSPCPYDRVFATRFGAATAELIAKEKYNCMVSLKNESIVSVPLEEVAGKLKSVPQDRDLIKTAQSIGISFENQKNDRIRSGPVKIHRARSL